MNSAILWRAILSGSDLFEAKMIGVFLRGANLTGVNLKGANMSNANLSGANLNGITAINLNGCPSSLPRGWVCENDSLIKL